MRIKVKWLLIGYFIFLAIGIVFIIIKPLIMESYMSVKSTCTDMSEEELNNLGYMTLGTYRASSQNITIYVDEEEHKEIYDDTLIHENCHKEQHEENRAYGCSLFPLKFINELECKIRGKL